MTVEIAPQESASEAGLHYVTDRKPGIRRRRAGRGFSFRRPDGSRITDGRERERIKALAIPPAWTDVWICTDPRGHLQATGRDARGRKVYRYHPRWRSVRDEAKYGRLLEFGRALPAIRERVDEDLRRHGLPREKVLAVVVSLLERTFLRIGNQSYVRENATFGLTTLRSRHVTVGERRVQFRFRGKTGKLQETAISDRRLARVVAQLQELPGQELFQYVDDDGETRSVTSDDVNEYLREISGEHFTAKDFRTWAGSVLAVRALEEEQEDAERPHRPSRHDVVEAIKDVAHRLGNTPAVARSAYVDPAVVDAYLNGGLPSPGEMKATDELAGDLEGAEHRLLALLASREAHPKPAA